MLTHIIYNHVIKNRETTLLIIIWNRTKRPSYLKSVQIKKKSGNVPIPFCTHNNRPQSVCFLENWSREHIRL